MGGGEKGEFLFDGIEFQFDKMKSSEDLFYNSVNVLNSTVHLKMVKMINFMFFATIKIKVTELNNSPLINSNLIVFEIKVF